MQPSKQGHSTNNAVSSELSSFPMYVHMSPWMMACSFSNWLSYSNSGYQMSSVKHMLLVHLPRGMEQDFRIGVPTEKLTKRNLQSPYNHGAITPQVGIVPA